MNNWETLPLTLTARHISEILGISLPSAYALMHRDGFPSFFASPRRLVSIRDSFRAWCENQTNEV